MNVEITLLGRPSLDTEFTELWNSSVDVGDSTVTVAPVVPPQAAGWDLELVVFSSALSVSFATYIPASPEKVAEAQIDAEAVMLLQRLSPVFGAFAGQPRKAPFRGTVVALVAVGAQPAPYLERDAVRAS